MLFGPRLERISCNIEEKNKTNIVCPVWSRDSFVGIATGYGLDDQGEREFESR
jgi:hypothetical protein